MKQQMSQGDSGGDGIFKDRAKFLRNWLKENALTVEKFVGTTNEYGIKVDGVNPRTIYRFLEGKRASSSQTLQFIAKRMGVSAEVLLRGGRPKRLIDLVKPFSAPSPFSSAHVFPWGLSENVHTEREDVIAVAGERATDFAITCGLEWLLHGTEQVTLGNFDRACLFISTDIKEDEINRRFICAALGMSDVELQNLNWINHEDKKEIEQQIAVSRFIDSAVDKIFSLALPPKKNLDDLIDFVSNFRDQHHEKAFLVVIDSLSTFMRLSAAPNYEALKRLAEGVTLMVTVDEEFLTGEPSLKFFATTGIHLYQDRHSDGPFRDETYSAEVIFHKRPVAEKFAHFQFSSSAPRFISAVPKSFYQEV